MDSSSEQELLLDAFRDYVREKRKSDNIAHEYRQVANQLIEYVKKSSPEKEWLVLLENDRLISDFLKSSSRAVSKATQSEKDGAIRELQIYVKKYGRLAWWAAWVKRRQNRPLVYLLGLLFTGILALLALLPLFGLPPENIPGLLFPSRTPIVTNTQLPTNTPTQTLIPSPTSTRTPTLTPTPNKTQIFLATQLPTVNPDFTPLVRAYNDGSEQVFVPAGSFIAGDHSGVGFPDEIIHQVYTDSFWIDRFLVTNGGFAKCPENICGRPESFISHKRPNGYYGVPEYINYPVMEIIWSQAEAFCEWRGGRLPTEAEWEKAAGWDPISGQMLTYPWGNESPDKSLANYNNVDYDTTKVGAYQKGISSVGAYDMAGNVWEWVFDWYGPYNLSQQINPMGPSSAEEKVVRGGSWSNNTDVLYIRVSNRGTNNPTNATNEAGFRCISFE